MLMAAFLVSCEKPENNNAQEPEYEISIRPAELLFEAEGGEQTITVTSKYGEEDAAWQISMDGEYGWFEVSASNGENSPLFVDLVDDFNQGSLNSKYPTDRIENVPNSLISIIAEEDYDWNDLKSRLQNYVGTYYTEQDLTTYLSNYEYWFSKN